LDAELHYTDHTFAVCTVGSSFVNVLRKPATMEMIDEALPIFASALDPLLAPA